VRKYLGKEIPREGNIQRGFSIERSRNRRKINQKRKYISRGANFKGGNYQGRKDSERKLPV
jgi:hypothetical protein